MVSGRGARIPRATTDRLEANSVDPDDTPQNAVSHQGVLRLPLIQHLQTRHLTAKYNYTNSKTIMVGR